MSETVVNGTSVEPEEKKSPWRRPGFIASAAVVGLIVVSGAGLAVERALDDDSSKAPQGEGAPVAAPAPSTPAPSASSSAPASTGDSVCGLPAGEQTVPTTAPSSQWELVGAVAAPTAPEQHGPGQVDSTTGWRSCYAHSPTGALYAAANVLASTSSPQLVQELVEDGTVPGPGRDALAQLLAGGIPPNSGTVQLAGYTFLNYSDDVATIDMAVRASSGGTGHVPFTLQWVEGDWKLLLPPDGNLAAGAGPLPDFAGYTAWGTT
ncbi:hypothetical protein CLV92_11922 [Kineococcus xinjiangensis]|uniref:DUF8175 domain-containing protein n=1 Tax=Kineococcus xinjiangensis TaxID=512762 RepID=A0A2S6ICL5_9ACTN|nr:hypothetical protein [Kineococcus xinjiangensis]PPK91941.1 hypothetical protein CLV92_11922 [Kineococcus xinjiangensis]